ncbi:peptidoglycan D,D-transpeptidase FtsI family protein [Rariglobus hedericola]|uniref:Beta-lactamase n=1 Tax=Rariglobus hedericola TaxID=2597822 RepID=A0A556QR94_9BACT|nr:penicillin-binding transpeptidase domain-containing protein [Rariglobus hedericola]TSJ79160.1 peptidoglycan glycosyltransferase [Rariglobus hedericola]
MPDLGSERGSLVETHKGYNPRVIVFYLFITALLLILISGLAYQQLIRSDSFHESERKQNQRRVLVPGPRGNIYDRDGRPLVANRPRFAVNLYLGELRKEFRTEYIRIRKAYREADDKNLPTSTQMERIARFTVVKRYLDQINRTLGREEKLDSDDLEKHFRQQLLLPYLLVDDLEPGEYARLIEQLPVTSPLQVYASSIRDYPSGSIAAQTLGYVTANDAIEAAEDFPGAELTTFKMKGTLGREGLESRFDSLLQGETGGAIYRVDPAGYRINPPLSKRQPVHGHNLRTSIDADFQTAAEKAMADTELAGAAAAIDIRTGEVLVLASKPDYNLKDFIPRLGYAAARDITERGAWLNRATHGLYPPGSSFKILTAIAGLRAQTTDPEVLINCPGFYQVGGRRFPCHDGHAHGEINLATAIEKSCNVYFYKVGLDMGVEALAAEAKRHGFDKPTGIEISETRGMLIPDPAWKKERRDERWFPGDTANMAIGQGDVLVTPLQMAAFTASIARDELTTTPTLLHEENRLSQHSARSGLTSAQYAALVAGMEACTVTGTSKVLQAPFMKIPGLRIAGKTGTAQKQTAKGTINFAWFICFAPIENPQIAIAVVIEGDTPGEETAGGRYAVPIARAILKKWDDKQKAPPSAFKNFAPSNPASVAPAP